MFQMCGVFAEFERGMPRERVNIGRSRAKERGTKLSRRPIKSSVEACNRELRAQGMGILKVGRTLCRRSQLDLKEGKNLVGRSLVPDEVRSI
jgi:DNA invertase Pin-like site-specific DNA recombinase